MLIQVASKSQTPPVPRRAAAAWPRRRARMAADSLNVVVVGAGPAGCAAASALARLGDAYNVTVFTPEAPEKPESALPQETSRAQAEKAVKKKSLFINVALTQRGAQALESIDVKVKDLPDVFLRICGSVSHKPAGEPVYKSYPDVDLFAVSRSDLARTCAASARAVGVAFNYGYTLETMDPEANIAMFRARSEQDGTETTVGVKYDLLVGCDGGNSKVQSELARLGIIDVTLLDEQMEFIPVHLPPLKAFKYYRKEWDASTHFWASGNGRQLGTTPYARPEEEEEESALTLSKGPVASLVLGQTKQGFRLTSTSQAIELCKKSFPELLDAFATLDTLKGKDHNSREELPSESTYAAHSESLLKFCEDAVAAPVFKTSQPRLLSKLAVRNIVIIGDAAHPVNPIIGQGMNSGLEDISRLVGILRTADVSIEESLALYNAERCPDIHALVKLSYRLSPGKLLTRVEFIAAVLLREGIRKLLPMVVKKSTMNADLLGPQTRYSTIYDDAMSSIWLLRGTLATVFAVVGAGLFSALQ